MKLIPLTQGKFAMVDDEDYEVLMQRKWHFGSGGYPSTAIQYEPGKYKPRRMHHFILKIPKGMVPDHKNGDRLDHQRHNLRVATRSQNQMNQRKRTRLASSKHKGVYWANDIKRWRAYIHPIKGDRKPLFLGCFIDEDEAGRAYDVAALKFFGEFARLNFPSACQS